MECEIFNVNEFISHFYPERCPGLTTALKVINDLIYDMGASRWVAVAHVPVQNGPVALKNTLGSLRKVFYLL